MTYKNIIFLVLVLFLKTKTYSRGSLDTTLSGTDKSNYFSSVYWFDRNTYAKGVNDFAGGIGLLSSSSTSTVQFGCSFPVPTIYLNGQTLSLTSDLYLAGDTTTGHCDIYGPGFLILNGYIVHLFAPTDIADNVYLPGTSNRFMGNGNVLTVYGSLRFKGCPTASTNAMQSMSLYLLSSDAIMVDSNYTFAFGDFDILILPFTDLTFNAPGTFWGNCTVSGLYGSCSFKQLMTIGNNSTLRIAPDTTIKLYQPIDFMSSSSNLLLDKATAQIVTNNNLWATGGSVQINSASTITCTNSCYFNVSLYSTNLLINPASKLIIDKNVTFYN